MSYPKASYWNETVNSEIESIMDNHTWKLMDLPPKNKSPGHKWIFKIKMKVDSTIDRYKATHIVQGSKQQGVEDFGIYSYVSRITSIQTLIVITSINKFEIHQMNVKITFLK
jgi:hypothetical protein